MSLPPGFIDELRTRITLSSIVGRRVTWDMRKSNMAKGDWWAPCPFHQEKSASFHVDDRKGFYYCFGCHAKGDALTFLKESGNIGFMEAVEELAREAGMTMPARDPQAAQRADRRTQLAAVMEEAVKVYRLQLRTAAAGPARDYLARRRLSDATLDRWEIGYAPDARTFLISALAQKGIGIDMLETAGLAARAEDGSFYDRFRGRIIFPIRDGRGRAISLGGRAMDPNARAKYLNGPETELFDKGHNLFNLGPAREAAGKGQPLIVAEGYMDVIALVDAGFGAAVAPLGTAVTEEQLRLMWRVHPEPVIALDGDPAGIRAGLRVVDLALPLIEAGQGLRFAMLPGGKDPDDLIRAEGAAAMGRVIAAAEPMVNLLWRRETEGAILDSPERRAALDKRLRAAIDTIRDTSIRAHYAEEIRRMRWELFGQGRRPTPPRGRGTDPAARRHLAAPTATARASSLVTGDEAQSEILIEAVILATLCGHPRMVETFLPEVETTAFKGEGHDVLRHALLALHPCDPSALRDALPQDARAVLERLAADAHVRVAPPARPSAEDELVRLCLAEGFAKLSARRGVRAEIIEAMEDMTGLADEGITWRLSQAAHAAHSAERTPLDTGNDLGEDRAALSRRLQELLDSEPWIKKRR
ncbi:MAG: DNA primase [Paracoccaceae bacterium]|nr:MAG: DNA primase [Paracoccaceae bacterium]